MGSGVLNGVGGYQYGRGGFYGAGGSMGGGSMGGAHQLQQEGLGVAQEGFGQADDAVQVGAGVRGARAGGGRKGGAEPGVQPQQGQQGLPQCAWGGQGGPMGGGAHWLGVPVWGSHWWDPHWLAVLGCPLVGGPTGWGSWGPCLGVPLVGVPLVEGRIGWGSQSPHLGVPLVGVPLVGGVGVPFWGSHCWGAGGVGGTVLAVPLVGGMGVPMLSVLGGCACGVGVPSMR